MLRQLEQKLSYYLNYAVQLQRNGVENIDAVMMDIGRIAKDRDIIMLPYI